MATLIIKFYYMATLSFVEVCVAEWLTPRSPDLDVRGSSLTLRVVFLDKELYSTLSLFTQVYKWIPVTYCWVVNPAMDKHPIQGGVAILQGASC